MKSRILKYPVPARKGFALELPSHSDFLDVQVQRDEVVMWFRTSVEPLTMCRRQFRCIPTGIEFDDAGMTYLRTFQFEKEHLVFHLYELVS